MISNTVPVYPNGRGRYALGHPDGEVLRPGQAIEIVLAGIKIAGTVQKSDLGDYLLLKSGDRCGLCAGMRVVFREKDHMHQFSVEGIDVSVGLAGQPDLRCIALVERGEVRLLGDAAQPVSNERKQEEDRS